MELLGFLQHLASRQALFLVAVVDVSLILLHLGSPTPGLLPSLATLLPSSPGLTRRQEHEALLERLHAERARLSQEMLGAVWQMQNVSRTLTARAELVSGLDQQLGQLEGALHKLRSDWDSAGSTGGNL